MEKWEIAISICSAILGSTALVSLVQFLINRHDKKVEAKKGRWEQINEKIDKFSEKQDKLVEDAFDTKVDLIRTNLLLLMASYPSNVDEILHIAYKYFVVYQGDSYVTPIFNEWLKRTNIATPSWFDAEK